MTTSSLSHFYQVTKIMKKECENCSKNDHLSNIDFSFVHEFDDSRYVGVGGVSQNNDLVFFVELEEKRFEVWTASGQDNLVCTNCPAFGCEKDVGELFCAEKSSENS